MFSSLRQVTGFLLIMTLITGFAYPIAIKGVASVLFPSQAAGSLVLKDGKVIGSSLIAQNFVGAGYFHSRPSSAGTSGYDANNSSGSNLGVETKTLNDAIAARVKENRQDSQTVPADLVMASASGLDPDLSPAAALYQVSRVADARGFSRKVVKDLVIAQIKDRQLGFLGEPRVNVLALNLSLDSLGGSKPPLPPQTVAPSSPGPSADPATPMDPAPHESTAPDAEKPAAVPQSGD